MTAQSKAAGLHAHRSPLKRVNGRLAPRITDKQVVEIRTRRSNGESLKALAAAFELPWTYIGHLVRGKRRQNAGGPILKAGNVNVRQRMFSVGREQLNETGAAKHLGLTRVALASRLHHGWSEEEALALPRVVYNQQALVRPPGPSTAYISVSGGLQLVCIDVDMIERLAGLRWLVTSDRRSGNVYLAGSAPRRAGFVSLRKLVTGLDSRKIHTVNGNSFDCRRANLALAGPGRREHRLRSSNTSGITGVYWSTEKQRWIAKITISGRAKTLGSFCGKDGAAAAVAKHIEQLRGVPGVSGPMDVIRGN